MGSSKTHIAELAPDAAVLDDFDISGNRAEDAQDSVEEWMRGLGLID